jgi:hypothetical protein
MRGEAGRSCLDLLRTHHPEVTVVVLSASSAYDDIRFGTRTRRTRVHRQEHQPVRHPRRAPARHEETVYHAISSVPGPEDQPSLPTGSPRRTTPTPTGSTPPEVLVTRCPAGALRCAQRALAPAPATRSSLSPGRTPPREASPVASLSTARARDGRPSAWADGRARRARTDRRPKNTTSIRMRMTTCGSTATDAAASLPLHGDRAGRAGACGGDRRPAARADHASIA